LRWRRWSSAPSDRAQAQVLDAGRFGPAEGAIAVVRRLQSEINADIPALLITGDTAPERLQEAQESDFFLLHKPAANSKLRAAIGNLIQSSPDD